MLKLLLTSSGISNPSIHHALVDLLGRPIAESNALIVPTGIYPYSVGAAMAYKAVCGTAPTPLCELGWKSLGLLELTALPSIDRNAWVPAVEETDALLVWAAIRCSSATGCTSPACLNSCRPCSGLWCMLA